MQEDILVNAWSAFTRLEEEFKSIEYDLPLVEKHYDVWSMRLDDMLHRAGSIFDSFLRNGLDDTELNGCRDIASVRHKDRKDVNINDYEKIYNNQYKLSQESVFVKPIKKIIKPLEDWTQSNVPDWWQGYNKIKHDKFKNLEQATLKRTLNALASIFLVFTMHNSSREALIAFRTIHNAREGGREARWFIKETLRQAIPARLGSRVYVSESTIFSYLFAESKRKTEDKYREYHNPFIEPY